MADPASFLVLAPHALREWAGRPRRYLDSHPLPPHGGALVGAWYQNDEELDLEYRRRRAGVVRRMAVACMLILRHYSVLREARMIYCLDGIHYAVLLLMARHGLFNAEGKIIRRYCFHDKAWQNLAARLRAAPSGFQLEVITQEQFTAASSHLGVRRVIHRPWKIDTDWYHPAPEVLHLRAVLPGNISRDESIVPPLLHQGLSITRLARLAHLERHYAAEIADPRFELVTNATHQDYREHLHAAPAVLLPIVKCDNPAGLTAAMEAIATGIPLLANRCMGLTELFAECRYPVPMLENLDPAAWARAYHRLEEMHESAEFAAELETSRRLLIQHHSILPDGGDWAKIYAAACADESAATTPQLDGSSTPASA